MSARSRHLTLAILTAVYGLSFVDRITIALVAQDLKLDLGISDFQIGLLGGTAFAVVNALAALPIARLSERYRRTMIVGFSLVIASLFTALCGMASSFLQLVFARVGAGIGGAGTEAPSHSIISDLYPRKQRAAAIAVFSLGVPLASLVAAYAGGFAAQAYGWRITFLVLGAPGVILGVVGMWLMKEPVRESLEGPAAQAQSLAAVTRRLFQERSFRFLLAGACVMSFTSFGVNTFLPAYFVRSLGVSVANSAVLWGLLTGVGSTLGTLLGGALAQRLALRDEAWLLRAPAIGFVIGSVLLAAGFAQATPTASVALIAIGTPFLYTWMGPAIAATHDLLDSRARATGSALFLVAMHLVGQGFGPPAIGLLSDLITASLHPGGSLSHVCAQAQAVATGIDCERVPSQGIRLALIAFSQVFLVGALLFFLAGRRSRTEFVHAEPVAVR